MRAENSASHTSKNMKLGTSSGEFGADFSKVGFAGFSGSYTTAGWVSAIPERIFFHLI